MGKILDALKGKPAGTKPATTQAAVVNNDGDDKGRGVLSHLTHIAFVAFCAAMTLAVYMLGVYYDLPQVYCILVAGGCAAGLFGHGSAVTRPTTNTSRTMHGLALGTWLVLSLFLAALYMFISSDELSKFLPPDMITVGAVIYSLTFAIGLFTSVIALVVPSVAERKIADGEHATLGAAVSKYGETVAILIAIAVSSFHIFQFGQVVARLDIFSVVTATVMADLAFLTAEKRVVSELRTRAATGRYDRFDLILWGVFGLSVIFYLVLVNLFTVRHSAGTLNEADPLFKMTLDFYGASPSILLFLIAALSILTALIDNKVGAPAQGEAPRITRPIASRAADAIRGTRAGIAEVKQAWREAKPPAQLPAGMALDSTIASPALSDESNGWRAEDLARYPGGRRWSRTENGNDIDVVAIPGRRPNWTMSGAGGYPLIEREADSIESAKTAALAAAREHKAEPVKGRDYDTTGEIVLRPEDDTALREAFWRQTRGQQNGDGAKK